MMLCAILSLFTLVVIVPHEKVIEKGGIVIRFELRLLLRDLDLSGAAKETEALSRYWRWE
jgi:hypothetical protein